MKKSYYIVKFVLHLIQGILVGVSAIVPGVSGGALCVAFEIYEPVIELFFHPIRAIKNHYRLFAPFVIGWIFGFVTSAKIFGLIISSTISAMFFFGLICGSLPGLFKASEKSGPEKSWTPFVLSLAFAYFLFHIIESSTTIIIPANFLSYLLCGFLRGLGLIVPGFDPSSVLLRLGLYQPMAEGIGNLDFAVIAPVFIGIVVTMLLLARFVGMLFEKNYAFASRIVLGFMVALAVEIVPYDKFAGHPVILALSVVGFVVGFIVARAMDSLNKK